MKRIPIKLGDQFGLLTVVGVTPRIGKDGMRFYACECECGEFREYGTTVLNVGDATSCGCMRIVNMKKAQDKARKHAATDTRLYRTWKNMKCRCHSNSREYKYYKDRGIQVCEEWREDFTAFQSWALANGYKDNLTIEREDNDLGYSPDNCKWVPRAKQSSNRRYNNWVTAWGERKCASDWARDPRCKTTRDCIVRRVREGWKGEFAITTPPFRSKHEKAAFLAQHNVYN